MPRYHYAQTEQKSCSAVAAMVIQKELGHPATISLDKPTEDAIYRVVQIAPNTESLPHSVGEYLISKGCTVTVHNDSGRVKGLLSSTWSKAQGKLMAEGMYGLHKQKLKTGGVTVSKTGLTVNDFQGSARLMLVCLINGLMGDGLTHSILFRKEEGQYWVMNPDGGSDAPWSWAQMNYFLEGTPTDIEAGIGPVKYLYTGIGLRAT